MRLSVLDQSPIPEGSTGPDALRNTIDLAQLADELGYTRYWVAEHHGGAMLAGPSPEALIGPIGSATSRIRVGSGGVMLPHYSPFKVAETFSLLSGLFPGRIDLGIGRAPGTDPLTMYALQRDRRDAAPDDFPQQMAELMGYLNGTLPDGFPFQHLAQALPGRPEKPAVWLLGSSHQSATWAQEWGLPYAFADFINPEGADPADMVCVSAICAETDEEAERLASSGRMAFSMLRSGRPIPVPPVEKALRYLETRPPPSGRRAVLGSPATVKRGLEEVAKAYNAVEVMVVTITHDHAARRRSYELIAEAMIE
ncbi:MAG TPA: LLM class flavin-dependent oxidoreductase, partial [Thermoleophilaceae bacterium]|jgi:alkanesulfonate monooxygenase SsuD/methylene tetrahydromethanopterin reductase-like flavin-dependent oxidoreductase (luciferase family)|nr:LLM class flavin-dependent oxidoreductase [Thermoleophilaceae bacterium]